MEKESKKNTNKNIAKEKKSSSGKHVATKPKVKKSTKNNSNTKNKQKTSSKNNSNIKNKQKTSPKNNNKQSNINKNEDKNKEQEKDHTPKHYNKEETLKINKENREKRKEQQKKKEKIRRYILIGCGALALIYFVGVILFSIVCFPRTLVADTDLSFHDQNFMRGALENNAGDYIFKAEGLDYVLEIQGSQIDYNFNTDEVVQNICDKKNPFAWPYEVFQVHDFMSDSVVNYNKEATSKIAISTIAEHNKTAVAPQNANFECDASTKTANIKKEVIGNTLDTQKTLESILGYIGVGKRYLEVGEDQQILPTLYSDNEKIPKAVEQANTILKSATTFVMASTTIDTVDYKQLSIWLDLKQGYVAGLNDQAVSTWADKLADTYNTLGKPRTFTTPYGKTVTVSGGDALGWEIDQAGLIDILNKQALTGTTSTQSVPCSSTWGDYTGPGGRDWSAKYIDVDLSTQTARMFGADGSLVWQSPIVSGKKSEPTPTGLYTVKAKKSPTTLIGQPDPATGQPSYRSDVQYWMGFVGDMVGLHDAPWQSRFGGDWWVDHGSHGCVNLPTGAAASLYSLCQSGDPVICHN